MLPLLLGALAAATYTNPVIDRDLPDPGVLKANGEFWMVHTTGGPKFGWPLYRSKDLVNWKFVKHLLEEGVNKPAWMKDALWAPEIHQVKGSNGKVSYLATGTAWNPDSKTLCVGMAVSEKIDGPYRVGERPIVQEKVAVLDTNVYQENGKLYLLWKRDSNDGKGVGGSLRLRQLDSTGMAFAPNSVEKVILTGSADATDPAAVWEKGLIEAPWLIKRNGWYQLFYSGAFIDTTYSVGVARSRKLEGPYTRSPQNPILKSNDVWGGPGHGGFVTDDKGTLWHLYHARRLSEPKAGRKQMLDRVLWKNDWPTFPNGGTPTSTPQTVPAVR
ncbi:hypothetical protein EON81_03270 [bacterium]|nr:MAG: hypothetical protein EON81_03270 [bacterium]